MLRTSISSALPPDPESPHIATLRKVLRWSSESSSILDMSGVRAALNWTLSWAAVLPAASRLKSRNGEPNPRPDERCPCCERKILEIRGEAPTAVEVWICSTCFDGGIRSASQTAADRHAPSPAPMPVKSSSISDWAIARIRREIEDWQEAQGNESVRTDVSPEHRERAAEKAVLLNHVLSLFFMAGRSSDSSDPSQ